MKLLIMVLVVLASALARADTYSSIEEYLREYSQPPGDYVLSKAKSHRITIIGESHWLKQDVALINTLIPALGEANIDLAVELLPASEQHRIDELITSPEWSDEEANTIMRAAEWPYQEYRDLLHSAWSTNQHGSQHFTILALGPSADWRSTLLPKGKTYDSFMADLVAKHLSLSGRRVLAYTGMHHAFTRYYQAELNIRGAATAFMDRMGNILSRGFGEQVFLIALHKPIWCGDPDVPSYCLPFAGRIDCAALRLNHPVGFDVVASPVAGLRFESDNYYGYAHPALRFVDYTDGYVWLGPVDSFRPVAIIPLSDYAPSDKSLGEVLKRNPFTDESDVTENRLHEIWEEQLDRNEDYLAARRWKHLTESTCDE